MSNCQENMPQDMPWYPKLVFITSQSIVKEEALWLYRKLAYKGFPVTTGGVDEKIGGGGFSRNAVAVAEPIIAVVGNHGDVASSQLDGISYAIERNVEVIYAVFATNIAPEEYLPDNFDKVDVLDFRSKREEAFDQLLSKLNSIDYPLPIRRNFSGSAALKQAREFVETHSYADQNFTYYRDYLYMQCLMSDQDFMAKKAAIRDLGTIHTLYGPILAMLTDDPSEEVRAEACLALARMSSPNSRHHILALQRAVKYDSSATVRLFAQVGIAYMQSTDVVRKMLSEVTQILAQHDAHRARLTSKSSQERTADVKLVDTSDVQVFISYARADTENLALRLFEELRKNGINAWIDNELQPATDVWTKEIEKAIQASSLVIALLSPKFHESRWVASEINYALDAKKEILPVQAFRTNKPLSLSSTQGLRGDPVLSDNFDIVSSQIIELLHKRSVKQSEAEKRILKDSSSFNEGLG
jgi:hypothetical protein